MAFITQYEVDRERQNRMDQGLNTALAGFKGLEENRLRALETKRKLDNENMAKQRADLQEGITLAQVGASPEEITDYRSTGNAAKIFEKYAQKAEEAKLKARNAEELDKKLKESQINKNNSAQNTPKENLTYKQKLELKAQMDEDKKAKEAADPKSRLDKLGAEGRSKVGSIASGFQAIDQMSKAMADGHGPEYVNANTAVLGNMISDTPYSEGERMLSEVIGRLQSGGAINDQEIKTFRALGPRPGDSKEAASRKLVQQRDFLMNKLTAFGLKEDELGGLGFEVNSKYSSQNRPQISEEDTMAINWAKSNPNDPRAQQILKLHGAN